MLYKKRQIPAQLLGYIALDKRVAKDHPQRRYINQKLHDYQAGYAGEREYDKFLAEFKPDYPHAILHDVSLQQDGVYFQMDSILITPGGVILSEIKNHAGKIIIKANPTQFIIELPYGDRKPIRNPITELERKSYYLERWLGERGMKVPIRCTVVFAYENELVIEETPNNDIIFTYEAPAYLRSLTLKKAITQNEIHSMAKLIKQEDQPFKLTPLTKFLHIHPEEIKTGVHCPSCEALKMKRQNRKWHCLNCGHTGESEHVAALQDWFLLMDNKITNRHFRKFTNVECREIARRLLVGSGLKSIGRQSQTCYIWK